MIRADKILVPKTGTDITRYAVIACDQFTQNPSYWQQAAQLAGNFSALHMVLPEIYLSQAEERIPAIHQSMQKALEEGLFTEVTGMVLVERTLPSGLQRLGLVAAFDLEAYNYQPGSQTPIRATEKTIVERLPPRVAIRRGAPLELPHVQLLIDDSAATVLEPIVKSSLPLLYDAPLMLGGGHIRGWLLERQASEKVLSALQSLPGAKPGQMLFAVGDGNHSLAAAKAYWEELKPGLSLREQANHPARFALCEVINLHSPALRFHPIHRLVFAPPTQLLPFLAENLRLLNADKNKADFLFVSENGEQGYSIGKPRHFLPVGSLQAALDDFTAQNPCLVDFVHEAETVAEKARQGACGLLVPALHKNQLFPAVEREGVLPRKTFSMGEGVEKRYYLEARRITI